MFLDCTKLMEIDMSNVKFNTDWLDVMQDIFYGHSQSVEVKLPREYGDY